MSRLGLGQNFKRLSLVSISETWVSGLVSVEKVSCASLAVITLQQIFVFFGHEICIFVQHRANFSAWTMDLHLHPLQLQSYNTMCSKAKDNFWYLQWHGPLAWEIHPWL